MQMQYCGAMWNRAALQRTAHCQQTLNPSLATNQHPHILGPEHRRSSLLNKKSETLDLHPSQESDILETQSDHGPGFLTV